jgi:GNAT superfamily N-acetyltransferase
MLSSLERASAEDAEAIASLRNEVARHLTARYGKGPGSGNVSARGVLNDMRMLSVYVARTERVVIATLTLGTRKPWAIDKAYFSACTRPVYLTSMAVAPDQQRLGIGRRCLDEAKKIAKAWPADMIRLDAFDAASGAGEFYRKCGFREVGRASYRGMPLIYFELPV